VIAADIDSIAGEVINVATASTSRSRTSPTRARRASASPTSLKSNVPERLGQVDRHIGSTDKAERLLGFRARTSFEEGLERTVEWLIATMRPGGAEF
jgi:nucleoside-diphosphate-sugar epimerase